MHGVWIFQNRIRSVRIALTSLLQTRFMPNSVPPMLMVSFAIRNLGPIGANLATALIEPDVDHVVFLGRRLRENVHVLLLVYITPSNLLPGPESAG